MKGIARFFIDTICTLKPTNNANRFPEAKRDKINVTIYVQHRHTRSHPALAGEKVVRLNTHDGGSGNIAYCFG